MQVTSWHELLVAWSASEQAQRAGKTVVQNNFVVTSRYVLVASE